MRFTIKLKLFLTFGFIIAILVGIAGFGINGVSSMNSTLDEVIHGPAERLKLAQRLKIDQLQQIRQQKNMLSSSSIGETNGYIKISDVARANFAASFQHVLELATAEGKANWAKLEGFDAEFRKFDDRIRSLVLAGDAAGALRVSTTEARDVTNEIDALLSDVVALEESRLLEAIAATDVTYANTRATMIGVALAAAIGAAIAAIWIVLSINRGLAQAVGVIQNVSEGDLTTLAPITTKDEIGELLGYVNTMIERLRGVVGDALSASDNVSSGSQELSSSSEQLSEGATEQAAAAEQASASMEEMASNIKQNADNAAQTEKIARQSSKDADRPSGAERGGGSRPRRRTRQGFRSGRLRSAQARRTQPGRRRRNQHAVG